MNLNCDLGENVDGRGIDLDAELMPFIDQANIACGFHAGDASIASRVLDLAAKQGVAIGAHPSYPDRKNFGRKSMRLDSKELTAYLHYQIGGLDALARSKGLQLSYVKPHGALYNDMMVDADLRNTVLQAMSSYSKSSYSETSCSSDLALMILSTSAYEEHQAEADTLGIKLLAEGYADRCYDDDGRLLGRDHAAAVHDESAMLAQVFQLMEKGSVATRGGKELFLAVDSICVHGDNPAAVKVIARVNQIVHKGVHKGLED
jgi:5-oxoprolinase (ATP-hydrolysing) subunit A